MEGAREERVPCLHAGFATESENEMKRRRLISLALVAAASVGALLQQQPRKVARIGFLSSQSPLCARIPFRQTMLMCADRVID